MKSVSSLKLVGLAQEMIVMLGLTLKVATIILGCIFSMLFSDFRSSGPMSILTPPIYIYIYIYIYSSLHFLCYSNPKYIMPNEPLNKNG